MFRRSDFFIITAVMLSFIVSAFLWFVEKDQQQAIFTAIWIPAIFTFGIYFKLCALLSTYHQRYTTATKDKLQAQSKKP